MFSSLFSLSDSFNILGNLLHGLRCGRLIGEQGQLSDERCTVGPWSLYVKLSWRSQPLCEGESIAVLCTVDHLFEYVFSHIEWNNPERPVLLLGTLHT